MTNSYVKEFTVPIDSEFFISLAKVEEHSFLMLGVISSNGPKLLARVGKTFDIDPDVDASFAIGKKLLGNGLISRIKDEGVTRKEGHIVAITYQAYSISYEQTKDFLASIADIESRQLRVPMIRTSIIRVGKDKAAFTKNKSNNEPILSDTITDHEALDNEAMRGFLPANETPTHIQFSLQKLQDWRAAHPEPTSSEPDAFADTQTLQMSNTCRTTSKNLLEKILGFSTDISKYFFISPKFKCNLQAGQPDLNFYILPEPPNAVTSKVTTQQTYVLEKIYSRMEKIIQKDSDNPKTRTKFDSLKLLYRQIAGENQIQAGALLDKILQHEQSHKKVLYDRRNPTFFNKLLDVNSATENTFNQLKKKLVKDKLLDKDPIQSVDEENPKNSIP